MAALDHLIEGYRAFRAGVYQQNAARYRELAERQQNPKAMVIGCCDSRADPAMIFNADPGELFVLRNVANLVPSYQPDERSHGTSAALEFAVTVLGVSDIIVMGHARCGGIAALQQSLTTPVAGEFIPQWMASLRGLAEELTAAHPDLGPADLLPLLERRAVVRSLDRLRTFPFVRGREGAGTLRLHGMFYGIASGVLSIYDPASDRFENVPDEPAA